MVHRAIAPGEDAYFASFSWDRLMFDPLPGPRDPSDFEGLRAVGDQNFAVRAETQVRPPAGSLLPRMAADLGTEIFLLDPRGGAAGLGAQLGELTGLVQADQVAVVDVGGDILAAGDEEDLRSPLADALVLAAVASLQMASVVMITGAGVDGELSADEVDALRTRLGGELEATLRPEHAAWFSSLFEWHPSEATGLLWLAARGWRGKAELRDQGLLAELTDDTAQIYRLDARAVAAHNQVADALRRTRSLTAAEDALRALGLSSEIDYEREKAARRREASSPRPRLDFLGALARLDEYGEEALKRGVDFLTLRRIAEVLDLDAQQLRAFKHALRGSKCPRYAGVAWSLLPSTTPTTG